MNGSYGESSANEKMLPHGWPLNGPFIFWSNESENELSISSGLTKDNDRAEFAWKQLKKGGGGE